MAIPQVASGVRKGLRPISGRIAAGISPAASARPNFARIVACGKARNAITSAVAANSAGKRELA